MVSRIISSYDGCCFTNHSAAAAQVTQQMAQAQMGGNPMAGVEDPDKHFNTEIENLEVIEHIYILDGVEERLLAKLRSQSS